MDLFDVEDVVSRMYRWTYSSMRSSIDRGIFFSYSLIYNDINNTGIWDRVFHKNSGEIVFYLKGFDYTKEDLERIVIHKQKYLQHYLKRKKNRKGFLMTKEQLKNLCAEFGMEMIDYRNLIIYYNCVVGNYYFDIDCISYKIAFIGSYVNTKNYETAQKEAMRKTKEIKDYVNKQKLEKIKEDF